MVTYLFKRTGDSRVVQFFAPFLMILCLLSVGEAVEPETVITDPVSVAQYDDAIVIYFHGFDVARTTYPDLELSYRLILADGTLGDEQTLDLTQDWEKPAIILRKDATEYAAVLVTASGGTNVFFRRLYSLNGTLDPQTQIATLAQNAVIEPGQFLEGAPPTIPQPDLSALDTVTIGAAGRTVDMDANSFQANSSINYPLVDSGQNGPLSLQTDFPTDLSKRSIYVVLKFNLYDQVTGDPGEVRRVLCEIPLNSEWLNGTEDLVVNLEASDIKVHATQQQYEGNHILPSGRGGLGQSTGTMSRDADFNIWWSGVPSQIVRFNPTTAEFEIPPVSVKDLMYDDRPTREEVLGETGNTNKLGHYGSYRMIWSMNNITPQRMIFSSVQNRQFDHGFFWGGMWTVPQDHWDDPVAFAANWHFPVAAWPSAPHDFWDIVPEIGGPNYRLWHFNSYGNTIYVRPYPGSVGGPWRVDLNTDGSVQEFGTEASGVFTDYDDALTKPVDATPYNAANKIAFQDYGVLIMSRTGLKEAITGIKDNSLSGEIEINYDAIDHMLQSPANYAEILDNIGGPSLAPGYMATHIPGQDGQVLGAAEYGYYLSQLDMNTSTPGEVDKTYLELDSADPDLELPLKVGLGPYGHQWCDINGDDWLYIGGYIGMTRFQYSSNGVPLQRFSMDKFDTRMATTYLDGANAIVGGAIKRYRYMQHGIDDLMFVTGTHTAPRGGTAFSGGLMSFHKTQLDTRWKLSYMSRCYNTLRLRNRVIREADGSLLQEFCHLGWFNSDYVHTIPTEHVPANEDSKIFCYDYPSGGTMRDRMGFSAAGLNGGTPRLADIAYSSDRRYLVVRQESDRLLTFDPQTNRYIDGVQMTFGPGYYEAEMNRPGHRLLRAPDDRLFVYAAPSDTDTNATFVEVLVSPVGEISLIAHTELQFASVDDRNETFDSTHTFLPDYANDDDSYDLWLGQNYSNPDTDCRLIEDFIPPRRHESARSLNILSSGVGGASVSGTKPGVTPYSAVCTDAETVNLAAVDPAGFTFKEWHDEDGNVLAATRALQLSMSLDRVVTAVYEEGVPDFTNLSPAMTTVDLNAQDYLIDVSSNTSWSVTSSPPWASVNPTSGTGDSSVMVSVQSNGSASQRIGSIVIGGQTHTLTQEGVPALGAVAGVSASDNTYSEKIRITWSPLSLAEEYRVWRAPLNDLSQAAEIAQLAGNTNKFDDTAVAAGTIFYYWIRGWRSSDGLGPGGSSNAGERAGDTGGDSSAEATSPFFTNGSAAQNGHLEAGDVDWYRFSVSPRRYVSLYTTGDLDTVGAVHRIDDPSTPLNSIETDDDGGDNANFGTNLFLQAGDYFVRISGKGDDQSGAYTLRIEMGRTASYVSDLWIGDAPSRMKGDNVYSLSGSGQSISLKSRRSVNYFVRAQNDGDVSEQLLVGGQQNNRNFRFSYFRLTGGRANVTSEITRGAFKTSVLDPGQFIDFQAKVNPRFSKGKKGKLKARFRASPIAQPNRQDVGQAVIKIRR